MWRTLVLSGGGVTGEFQVGALDELKRQVDSIDLYCGNGVGSLHTTLLAQQDDFRSAADAVIDLWDNEIDGDSSLFLKGPFGLALGALFSMLLKEGGQQAAVNIEPLRKLIERKARWEWLSKKRNWAIETVSLTDGFVYTLTTDPELLARSQNPQMLELSLDADHPLFIGRHFWDFVQAGAAVPIMFPPVTVFGHRFCEGGVRNYTPVSMAARALALAVERDPSTSAEVFIVDTWGARPAVKSLPEMQTGGDVALRSIMLMVNEMAQTDIDLGVMQMKAVLPSVKVTVIKPEWEFTGFTMDFSNDVERRKMRQAGRDATVKALAHR